MKYDDEKCRNDENSNNERVKLISDEKWEDEIETNDECEGSGKIFIEMKVIKIMQNGENDEKVVIKT